MSGRNVPAGLLAELQGEVLHICMCFKLSRQDGVVMGFTTHDRHVLVGGLWYESSSAFQTSSIRQEAGGNADNLDSLGLLSSSRITDEDLRAGLYDNAAIEVFICSWDDPTLGTSTIIRGNIGDVTITDTDYTAAMRSLMQRFQQQVGELTGPSCRVFELGDARCKFDLSGSTVDGNPARSAAVVTSVNDDVDMTLSGLVGKVGYYNYGTLKSTSGRNNGYVREVKLHSNGSGYATSSVSPSGVPTANLSYKKPLNYATSLDCVFAIPAGAWESATLSLTSTWALRSSFAPGTDELAMQFPPGQPNDVQVRQASVAGTYNDSFQFGDTTLALINAAAGGSMSLGLRHTAPSQNGPPFFNVQVTAMSLTLVGPGSGTSSRLVLHEAFPFPVAVGDAFLATTGCNRLPGTCTQKFNNIINIRCEPHVPGTEKLLQRGRPPQ